MKSIPIELQTHKEQPSTTLTDLMRIGPLPDGTYRGLTLLDVPVTYSGLTYHARTGIQASTLASSSDMGVDNSETETLLAVGMFQLEGITQAQIDSGALDKVEFVIYRVNYAALEDGHEVVASGTIGEVRIKLGGAAILEQRSISNQLKQTVGELDSRLCRVRQFGSQVGEERYPCLYDLAGEWQDGEVTDVDEADRVFAIDVAEADDYFAPGVVHFLTGANAGREYEIEAFVGGVVSLMYPTEQVIEVGDTFEIRRECSRKHEGHNSCRTFHDTEWVNRFRGEPYIPVGEASKLLTPGADSNYVGGN